MARLYVLPPFVYAPSICVYSPVWSFLRPIHISNIGTATLLRRTFYHREKTRIRGVNLIPRDCLIQGLDGQLRYII